MILKNIFTRRTSQKNLDEFKQQSAEQDMLNMHDSVQHSIFKSNTSTHNKDRTVENIEINTDFDSQDDPIHARLKAKKHRLEIIIAAILVIIIALVTWGQLTFFDTNSWIFFFLVNVNAILMLVVLFLVARNVIKLLLERRRKIFGSRLKTRLVLAFFSISFIPILIMFLASNKILTTSVNYWFTGQVEDSMQAALNVGQSFYNAASVRLKVNTETFIQKLVLSPKKDWVTLIAEHKKSNHLTLLGIIKKDNSKQTNKTSQAPPRTKYFEKIWMTNDLFNKIWVPIKLSINFQQIDQSQFESLLWADPSGDYVIVALPIPHHQGLYIIGAESIGKGLLAQLDKMSIEFKEYTKLKNHKQPLKLSFSLILGLLSLIVLFASVWLAFRISKGLTQPILALAKGTKHIAQGDWNFQVTDNGQDELGQLVHSFNAMTNEMRHSQDRLKKMNWLIEEKNETLIERNQYIEAILEHITTGIVTLNDKGTLLTINKAACNIFKIQAERYEGLAINMFLSKARSALIAEMYAFIKKNPEKIWVHEAELVREEQYSKILIQAVALPAFMKENKTTDSTTFTESDAKSSRFSTASKQENSAKNTGQATEKNPENSTKNNAYPTGSVILIIEDITELSQEQRLAAWREVAQRIAHEIKNPLTPIKLSAQRLQKKFSQDIEDPVFTQCTELIIKEVARMQSMVSDFSTFAALPTITLETEDITPILHELTNSFRTSHPTVNWHITQKTAIPALLLDKKALHRALFNILSNATDAIQTKKQKLVTSNIESNENNVDTPKYVGNVEIICFDTAIAYSTENGENLPANNIILEIQDNGAGINSEEIARLFEPYFSKKATGMGLGLAIVRSIITDHGGNISAHSQKDGTCIRISLPYKTTT